jgi:DNA-3-methyladenine glycosylase II
MKMSEIPSYWTEAKAHIRRVDPVLGAVIDAREEPPLSSKSDVFQTLVHAIVGQQISVSAADAIWGRFVAVVGSVDPVSVASHSPLTLRGVGLSGRKVEYILGLATDGAWVATHPWAACSDDEAYKLLVGLRGVGPWTARMVLIFSLLRPDLLPLGDIGVIRAVEQLYADGRPLSKAAVAEIAQPWAPFRTVATWYLWRHLDAEPVTY